MCPRAVYIGFAAIAVVAITVPPTHLTGRHRARAIFAGAAGVGGCITGEMTGSAMLAAVHNALLAAIEDVSVTIGPPFVTQGRTSPINTTRGRVIKVGTSRLAIAARVRVRRQRRLTSIAWIVVAITVALSATSNDTSTGEAAGARHVIPRAAHLLGV